ncbi:MAG: hypothetical protein GYB64_14515 [Chloroflexi bacterium]|nr:hypothetical protein [Chloroflexota bacterium]
MTFTRGNRAIRDHAADGKSLHLFEYVETGKVRYMGEMVLVATHTRDMPDVDGQTRTAIIFELMPLATR